MEISLHPEDFKRVIEAAPNAAVADAWKTGKEVAGQRNTLKLIAHTSYYASQSPENQKNTVTQECYDEGMKWWEEARW